MMRIHRRVGVLALTGLLAACGEGTAGGFHPSGQVPARGGSGRPAEPGTAAPGAGTPGAAGTAGPGDASAKTPQSALVAYRRYQRAYETAYESGDPSPLATVAMDPQLSRVTKDVRNVRSQGVIWRFHNVLNPRVQGRSADDSTVVIIDCVRTLGAYRFSAASGRRLGALPGGAFLYQAIMRFAGGSWRLSDAKQGRGC